MHIDQLRLKHRSIIVLHVARLYRKKSDPVNLQLAVAEFMNSGDLKTLLEKIKIDTPMLPTDVDRIYRALKDRIEKRNLRLL